MCVIKTSLFGIYTRIYTEIINKKYKDSWHNLGGLKSSCNSCQPILCCSADHYCFLFLNCSWNQQFGSSKQLILSCSSNQGQCLDLKSQPVLTCNQSAQSTIRPVCNLFGQHTQVYSSFRFVIIKTLYSIRIDSTNSPFLMTTN